MSDPLKVSRVEVYSARLRLVTDRKQSKVSPDWVVRLAETPLTKKPKGATPVTNETPACGNPGCPGCDPEGVAKAFIASEARLAWAKLSDEELAEVYRQTSRRDEWMLGYTAALMDEGMFDMVAT